MNAIKSLALGVVIAAGIVAGAPSAFAATPQCLNTTSSKAAITVTGNIAAATFTVPEACGPQQVSLVSYTAPSANGKPYAAQVVYKSLTQTFAVGTHSVTIAFPDCFYQVDLVNGTVITDFSKSTYSAEGRHITARNAGTKTCEVTPPVTPGTPVTPVTPPVAPVTPTEPSVLPNTGAGNVLGVVAATVAAATVLHANRRKLQNMFAHALSR